MAVYMGTSPLLSGFYGTVPKTAVVFAKMGD